ncbi:MAG: hypothetical protein H6624_07310 [Bdellovibrionaceae bacterium]|nr:hypothetical protein [Bdellovibrionales bacterium]MCB9084136.1 hypothetical protein [Pseudobdellovibrionaceae bacterium]
MTSARRIVFHTIFLASLLFHIGAMAKGGGGKSGNLRFEGSLGVPNVGIENPDGSSAYYDGLAMVGRVIAPVFGKDQFWVALTANLRYLDLENTANSGTQKEFASQLGPGLGLRFSVGKIFLGADYFVVQSKHYAFGGISNEIKYTSSPLSYYVGMEFSLGSLSMGLAYIMSSGTIGVDDTGLAADSPYTDSLAMVTLSWDSGVSFGKFAADLVKK